MDSRVLEGRESVEDAGRAGNPKDATANDIVRVVYILVMCDNWRDLRSIARGVS